MAVVNEALIRKAASGAATVIQSRMNDWFMPVRPEWNAQGPPVSGWFRGRLASIDRNLVLQFIPPMTQDADGVDPELYPYGVWAICYRMGRTKWLAKQWVYGLVDDAGNYCPPDGNLVKLLEMAMRISRYRRRHLLAEAFDRHMEAIQKDSADASRQQNLIHMAELMRKSGMTSTKPRVFVGKSIQSSG